MAIPLIFYYHRLNCYSFNALAGAIDANPEFRDLTVDLALSSEQLVGYASTRIAGHGRAIAALSILTCQFEEMQKLIKQLKSSFGQGIIILAGGPHPTACPDEILDSGADIVFRGESEISFPEVLKQLFAGKMPEPVQTQTEQILLDRFCSFSPKRGMFGPIEITRGCAFACNYCQTSRIFGTQLRHKSIPAIMQQAEALRSVNRKVVRLLSPNAFSYGSPDGREMNPSSMRELLSTLRATLAKNTKIIFAHFPSEVRPEHVVPETLDLVKEFADNDEIVIGAQSGSERMLEACHRAHDVASVLRAVRLARKYGFKIIVDFIFGLPGETPKDLAETLRAMEEIVRLGARIHPHIFAPLPQTPFENAETGKLTPPVLAALERFKKKNGIYE